jgi:hypothetical protein
MTGYFTHAHLIVDPYSDHVALATETVKRW